MFSRLKQLHRMVVFLLTATLFLSLGCEDDEKKNDPLSPSDPNATLMPMTLEEPSDGAEELFHNLRLRWDDPNFTNDAPGQWYRIYFGREGESVLIDSFRAGYTSYDLDSLLPGTTYEWSVEVRQANRTQARPSETWSFTTRDYPDEGSAPIYPAPGAVISNNTTKICFRAPSLPTSSARRLTLNIGEFPMGGDHYVTSGARYNEETGFWEMISPLFNPNSTQYWSVNLNPGGTEDWTPISSFRVTEADADLWIKSYRTAPIHTLFRLADGTNKVFLNWGLDGEILDNGWFERGHTNPEPGGDYRIQPSSEGVYWFTINNVDHTVVRHGGSYEIRYPELDILHPMLTAENGADGKLLIGGMDNQGLPWFGRCSSSGTLLNSQTYAEFPDGAPDRDGVVVAIASLPDGLVMLLRYGEGDDADYRLQGTDEFGSIIWIASAGSGEQAQGLTIGTDGTIHCWSGYGFTQEGELLYDNTTVFPGRVTLEPDGGIAVAPVLKEMNEFYGQEEGIGMALYRYDDSLSLLWSREYKIDAMGYDHAGVVVRPDGSHILWGSQIALVVTRDGESALD